MAYKVTRHEFLFLKKGKGIYDFFSFSDKRVTEECEVLYSETTAMLMLGSTTVE